MKKCLLVLLALALLLSCAACGKTADEDQPEAAEEAAAAEESAEQEDELYVAMLTDIGSIDDQSFNQACWDGMVQFAEEFGVEYAYYRPANHGVDALTAAITSAADEGVDVLVCPGSLFESVICDLQYEYPEISFLLIDGEPHPANSTAVDIAANVHCIVYQEEQAGFLAGYAAVTEGLTKLGFVGGMEVPAVTRYGYGFIQGADYAAQKAKSQVVINYWYSGSFDPSDEVYQTCRQWYGSGTQAIFACGGNLFTSVLQAADEADDRYMIGVDVDQAALSASIITSAMKDLQGTTYTALCALMDNQWQWPDDYAGQTAHLGAADQAAGLPTAADSWRFKTFTQENYEELLNAVIDGSVTVSDSIAGLPETTNTTVNVME